MSGCFKSLANLREDVFMFANTKKHFETSVSGIKSQKFNEYFKEMSEKNVYIPDCDLMEYEEDIHIDIYKDLVCPNDVRLGLKDVDR